eukprot:scaffold146749_cov74-Cyclotella_meneghiniana.AAC.1
MVNHWEIGRRELARCTGWQAGLWGVWREEEGEGVGRILEAELGGGCRAWRRGGVKLGSWR